jgi:lipopolysaccharide/colanic/teichoic acid biosynthesis glycosyltransferase
VPLKRLLDVVASSVLLLLSLPLLLALAVAVRVLIGRPVIFRQRRPGLHGEPFELLKFRTMSNAVDAGGRLLSDDKRLGRFGSMLRALSLDELPELVNVLRGDMSLVGPRPLLMHYLDRYDATQARRHDVPPGITGWAQINGRNAISWEERFALDVWYVDHRSFSLDLRILMITAGKVFRREGITQPGHATMPEFTGRRS